VSEAAVADRPGEAGEPRMGRRGPRLPSWEVGVLTAVTVAVAAVLAHYSFRLWTHNYDEDIYKLFGLYTFDHLPGSLWTMEGSDRGVQRIGAWIIGGSLDLFGSPQGFRVTRLVEIVVYCSTVIPVWLWARRAGASRPWALAAALLAVIVPWATVTATFMTENVAYPLCAWALYAIWNVAVNPRLGPLVLAGAAVVAAALGRSVMMLLIVVLVVTMVGVGARCYAVDAWRGRGSWTWRQILPWAVLGAGALVAAGLYLFDRTGIAPLTGTYSTYINFQPDLAGVLLKRSVAKAISGTGILPGIIATAFVVRALWRPARPASFALSLIAVQMVVFCVYSSTRAGIDERYLMYLAPVIAVCAAVALSRREVGPAGVVGAAIGVVVLFAIVTWDGNQQGFGNFVSAAEVFHARVMLLGYGSRLPNVGLSYAALLAVTTVVVAVIAAWALWRRGRWGARLAVVLALGVLGVQIAQTVYVSQRFTSQANWAGKTVAQRAWVDGAVGDHDVGFFASRTGADWDLAETWREVAFWNLSIKHLMLGPRALRVASYGQSIDGVGIDPQTGRLGAHHRPIPPYLLEWTLTPVSPLVGRTVATTDYLPFALVAVNRPARVAWWVRGTDPQGWTVPRRTATIRVFKDAPGGRCLDVTVVGAPGLTGRREVRIGPRSVRVASGQPRVLRSIPLRGGTAAHYADLRVEADGTTLVPGIGQRRGVQVSAIARTACG